MVRASVVIAVVVVVAAIALAAFFLVAGVPGAPAAPVRVRMASLVFPSYMSILQAVVEEKGFDEMNGVTIEWRPYSAISAFYSSIVAGEVDGIPGGGPAVFQKMRLQGVPLKITSTLATMTLRIVARSPEVRSLEDLLGRSIAIDVGATDYPILRSYVKKVLGVDMEKAMTVVAAVYPVARAQLQAGRVEAAVLVEPHITLALRNITTAHVIFDFNEGWRELTGHPYGIYLVTAFREDFLRDNPDVAVKIMRTLQDAENFIMNNPDEADRIISARLKLPPGLIAEAVRDKRIEFKVLPAWEEPAKSNVWDLFKFTVETGYNPSLPDEEIIFTPP